MYNGKSTAVDPEHKLVIPYPHLEEAMQEAGLEEVEEYYLRR